MRTLETGSEPASCHCANQSRQFLIRLCTLRDNGVSYCVRTALALLPLWQIYLYSWSQGELVFKKEEIEVCGWRYSAGVNWQKCIDCTGYFDLCQLKIQPHGCFIQQRSTTSTGTYVFCWAFFFFKYLFINQTRKYKKPGFLDLVHIHAK